MPLLHTKERYLSSIVAKVTQIRIHFPDTFPFSFHQLKRTGICYNVKGFISYYLSILSRKSKGLKVCLQWKVHLAYPARLQALQSDTQKQIIQTQHNRVKNPNSQKATSQLFTSAAEDLNSGRPRTSPASCQSGTRTRDRWIASPTR